MKTVIHVNQHNIKRNRSGARCGWPENMLPVLTVKDYKQNRKGQTAVIRDASGVELARVVYQPDKPLPCGAHVWIETQHSVEVY